MVKTYPRTYSKSTIEKKRKEIYNQLGKEIPPNFTSLKTSNIKLLFELYDKVFFQNQISNKIKDINKSGKLRVKLTFSTAEKKGFKIAGQCRKSQRGIECTYTLYFPPSVYIRLFHTGQKTARTGGILCRNRLQCLQMVFEHELIHLVVFLWDYFGKITKGRGKNIYSGHGKLFQCMVYSYFGHTEIRHDLSPSREGEKLLTKENVKIGGKYTFNYKGTEMTAIVIKKNPKTAKVQIIYPLEFMNRKPSVPYSLLRKSEFQ